MIDIELLVKFTKLHEGFSKTPYRDPLVPKNNDMYPNNDLVNLWTIGYGQLCRYVGFPFQCTEDLATTWLTRRLNDIHDRMAQHPAFKDIHPVFHNFLVALSYQVGIKGLSKFTKMLDALRSKNIPLAREELRDSLIYKQTPARINDLDKTFLQVIKL